MASNSSFPHSLSTLPRGADPYAYRKVFGGGYIPRFCSADLSDRVSAVFHSMLEMASRGREIVTNGAHYRVARLLPSETEEFPEVKRSGLRVVVKSPPLATLELIKKEKGRIATAVSEFETEFDEAQINATGGPELGFPFAEMFDPEVCKSKGCIVSEYIPHSLPIWSNSKEEASRVEKNILMQIKIILMACDFRKVSIDLDPSHLRVKYTDEMPKVFLVTYKAEKVKWPREKWKEFFENAIEKLAAGTPWVKEFLSPNAP